MHTQGKILAKITSYPKRKKKRPQSTARDRKWLKCENFRGKHSSMYSGKKRKNICYILTLGSIKNMTDHSGGIT